jgi:hypothetical protein
VSIIVGPLPLDFPASILFSWAAEARFLPALQFLVGAHS